MNTLVIDAANHKILFSLISESKCYTTDHANSRQNLDKFMILLSDFLNKNSSSFEKIEAQNYIICVGSEIKNNRILNNNLLNICKTIGPKLNQGDLVILRGTTQVGLSRKLLIPTLEKTSNLKCGKD